MATLSRPSQLRCVVPTSHHSGLSLPCFASQTQQSEASHFLPYTTFPCAPCTHHPSMPSSVTSLTFLALPLPASCLVARFSSGNPVLSSASSSSQSLHHRTCISRPPCAWIPALTLPFALLHAITSLPLAIPSHPQTNMCMEQPIFSRSILIPRDVICRSQRVMNSADCEPQPTHI